MLRHVAVDIGSSACRSLAAEERRMLLMMALITRRAKARD
jgi:hypothetical protein